MREENTFDGVIVNEWMKTNGNVTHIEILQRQNQALANILSLTNAVSTSLELREVVKATLNNTVKLFNATAGDITLHGLPEETRSVWQRRADRFTGHIGANAPRLSRDVSARVAKTGKPIVIEIEKAGLTGPQLAPGIVRLAVIPLLARGRVSGVITLGCGPDSCVMEIDPELLESIGKITGAAIENSRIYLRLKYVSDTDSLTGLYNYRFIMEKLDNELKRAARYKRSLSVMMLDIDNFKSLNDNYGHLFGDTVLKKTALALTAACRGTDFIGRYGGDEFIVVLPETEEAEASVVADRIRERVGCLSVKAPDTDDCVKVKAALGKSVFPLCGRTRKDLISAADKRLYEVKHAGHGRLTDFQAA
jgi:diguanylate cyclase (GGDEF)-like protein